MKLFNKYPDYVKLLKKLNLDDYEIEDKLYIMDTLKDWKPLTLREVIEMSDDERKKLLSFCWHDGESRCDTIGITNFEYHPAKCKREGEDLYDVNWSDINGDPSLYGIKMDTKINNIGEGDWNYGLFKRK